MPLRMIFHRPSALNNWTFPTMSYDDSRYETYMALAAELYEERGIYSHCGCPLSGRTLELLEVLEKSPPHDSTVEDSWLLLLPVCLQHKPCVFCVTEDDEHTTRSLAYLCQRIVQSSLSLLSSVHASISTGASFIPPLLASSRALVAGCALVVGIAKGWAGPTTSISALLQCSEILTFAAPHWKGGQAYLDVWRLVREQSHNGDANT